MKRLIITAALLLTTVFLFTACKKDKEAMEDSTSNSVTYANGDNPQSMKLKNASLDLGGNELILRLYETGTTGVGFLLSTTATNFTELPEGVFTQTSSGGIKFETADLYYGNNDISYTIKNIGRKISITKNGNSYKIDFEFTAGVGLVKGNYTGMLSNQ